MVLTHGSLISLLYLLNYSTNGSFWGHLSEHVLLLPSDPPRCCFDWCHSKRTQTGAQMSVREHMMGNLITSPSDYSVMCHLCSVCFISCFSRYCLSRSLFTFINPHIVIATSANTHTVLSSLWLQEFIEEPSFFRAEHPALLIPDTLTCCYNSWSGNIYRKVNLIMEWMHISGGVCDYVSESSYFDSKKHSWADFKFNLDHCCFVVFLYKHEHTAVIQTCQRMDRGCIISPECMFMHGLATICSISIKWPIPLGTIKIHLTFDPFATSAITASPFIQTELQCIRKWCCALEKKKSMCDNPRLVRLRVCRDWMGMCRTSSSSTFENWRPVHDN